MKISMPETCFVPGRCPHEGLVFMVDCFGAEVDRVRKLVHDGGDHNVAAYAKIDEGEKPRTSHDAKLAKRTFQGAVDLVELYTEAGWDWGPYSYATIGRDGSFEHWDSDDEADWTIHQIAKLDRIVAARGLRPRTLRTCLDVEDHKRKLTRAERTLWIHQWIGYMEDAQDHDPLLYVSARYLQKYLFKAHGLERLHLWEPHYGRRNDPDRILEAPELPRGFEHRAAWQYTSKYRGGLDRSVARLSALRIPGAST